MRKDMKQLPVNQFQVKDIFWGNYLELVRASVIPYQWEALNDRIEGAEPSHCIRNFEIAAGRKTGEFSGFVFQDSDLYKWLEAAAYSLMRCPDADLEKKADEAIELIGQAQQPDGYLDTYYIINGLENRFTDLESNHELYCLGHMIEAATAYAQATGKRRFLEISAAFADCAAEHLGKEPGKLPGYPGHEVAEMALVKLYAMTGEKKYLRLASYFIDQRGQQPLFFEQEDREQGRTCYWRDDLGYRYYQAAEPVRGQQEAEGHAVRAVYLYSGMADVARETEDEELFAACKRIWKNIVEKKLYLTGAVGASAHGESFSYNYNLPNDLIYGETCAAVGLVFLAKRMFEMTGDSSYLDVMERALYNGVISGMSLDGKSFFYVNPLEVTPQACHEDHNFAHVKPVRQKWFGCACCPPNLARLLSSVANYAFTTDKDGIYLNLFMGGRVSFETENCRGELEVSTDYPWDGRISVRVVRVEGAPFTMRMRVPGWCRDFAVFRNGGRTEPVRSEGFAALQEMRQGEEAVLELSMPVELIAAHPNVRADMGKAAVMRGPLVYCLEEADNGSGLHRLSLPAGAVFAAEYRDMLGGVTALTCSGLRKTDEGWEEGDLYQVWRSPAEEPVTLTWIPYYAWANRGEGEMSVWIRIKE
ncbi:glycoside hydrolase family 127 protein [Cuneatibacter caecimuris]|uniref:Glycoside hydrolase family 127 protein n=1 Tax=Cuneatibacter caecimuris TaxID=1796618 RepID=A0A4Q7PLL4_9FIRM|nr:beta-L-arabinofuranosidase domain-containing protein [Cuneatibacter caecimuris]RZT01008.1 hypothetical protein EV209_1445 [Cuneatibacter caecimuris]